jgi:hypothetical protein
MGAPFLCVDLNNPETIADIRGFVKGGEKIRLFLGFLERQPDADGDYWNFGDIGIDCR